MKFAIEVLFPCQVVEVARPVTLPPVCSGTGHCGDAKGWKVRHRRFCSNFDLIMNQLILSVYTDWAVCALHQYVDCIPRYFLNLAF